MGFRGRHEQQEVPKQARGPLASPLHAFITTCAAIVLTLGLLIIRGGGDFPFAFVVTVQSSTTGTAQIFYDLGAGLREEDSSRMSIGKIGEPLTLRFPLSAGEYHMLRFDPINKAGTVTLSSAHIVDRHGTVVLPILPQQFQASQQIHSLTVVEDGVQVTTVDGAYDPTLTLGLSYPLTLRTPLPYPLNKPWGMFLWVFILCSGGLWLADYLLVRWHDSTLRLCQHVSSWAGEHPKTVILAAAVLATIASCYPVLLYGKSFVSPNNGTLLLYDHWPTVPGSVAATTEDAKGSDIAAVLLAHLPYTRVESQALSRDFTLPLWNRSPATGLPLLGQGQSMFGDPLHALVLLMGGATWAWDFKYVVAKIWFALGIGVIVYASTQHLPASVLLTMSSVFIGFFSYRFNHPAFFSFCYAPWIIYCWLRITSAPTLASGRLWMCGLLAASWMELTSGTVKEAYILLVSLHGGGLLLLVLSQQESGMKKGKLLQTGWIGLLLLVISSPLWWTFLGTLRQSYSLYLAPQVWQIPPSLMLGFFDDIFYRQISATESVLNPSANFCILLGVLWGLACLNAMRRNPVFLAAGISALILLAFVFGVVSPTLLRAVPFVGNIYHIDGTFSLPLIIYCIMLAGFGFSLCWRWCTEHDQPNDLTRVLFLLGLPFALYLGTTQAVEKPDASFLRLVEPIPKSHFFYLYSGLLLSALIVFPLLLRSVARTRPIQLSLPLLLSISIIVLHWRHGMYLHTAWDSYVMNPQERVDLTVPSPAIAFVQSNTTQPFRTMGVGANLFPGAATIWGLESIDSVDALLNPYVCELLTAVRQSLASVPTLDNSFPTEWEQTPWRLVARAATLPQLRSVYDFLNVQYYFASLSEQEQPLLPGLRFLSHFDLDVYTSDSAWPRAFFADTVSVYEQVAEFVQTLQHGDGRPFAAITRADLAHLPWREQIRKGQTERQIVAASAYRLTTNTTSFTVQAPNPGVIVLTEAYLARDFRVTVNGQAVPYFRVNHAFKGIWVNAPGQYDITFSYWPRHLTLTLMASGIGVIVFGVWASISWRMYRKERVYASEALPRPQALRDMRSTYRGG